MGSEVSDDYVGVDGVLSLKRGCQLTQPIAAACRQDDVVAVSGEQAGKRNAKASRRTGDKSGLSHQYLVGEFDGPFQA